MADARGGTQPAATLVILRDGPKGLEVLLTLRPRSMRFMGGAAVFPGGALSQGDSDYRWEAATNMTRAEAVRALGDGDPVTALATFVCALREAFEEVGFCIGSGPIDRVSRVSGAKDSAWLEHLLELGVVLDASALIPAGRWVTPMSSPVRFDARFFVTAAPPGWIPNPDRAEVQEAHWTTPAAAIADLGAGRLSMAPPTILILQRLEACSDVADALASLRTDEIVPGADALSVQVHPMVRLLLAPNPGPMTGPGTNTYVVDTEDACVIDPAVSDADFMDAVIGSAASIATIVVTHRHADHTGGVRRLADLTGASVRAVGEADAGGAAVVPLADREIVTTARVQLECIFTPGHASDHVCLMMGDILFSGDTILGEGTAVIAPPDGSLADYLASLTRLRNLDITRIFPGHWRTVIAAREVIDYYLAHRAERHSAILSSLTGRDLSIDEIVARVYTDTPSELHPIAKWSVMAHLEMAMYEGQVLREGQRWRRMDRG